MTPEFDKFITEFVENHILLEKHKRCTGPTLPELSDTDNYRWTRCVSNPYTSGYKRIHYSDKTRSFNYKRCFKAQKPGTQAYYECQDYWKRVRARRDKIMRKILAKRKGK